MTTILNPETVSETFFSCLYREDAADTSNHVRVRGIHVALGFNPDYLAKAGATIVELLMELPVEFHEESGESFLQACRGKGGDQWTGEHKIMDQLFMLGMGIGRVVECAPRYLWAAFPGGMPYYRIVD